MELCEIEDYEITKYKLRVDFREWLWNFPRMATEPAASGELLLFELNDSLHR